MVSKHQLNAWRNSESASIALRRSPRAHPAIGLALNGQDREFQLLALSPRVQGRVSGQLRDARSCVCVLTKSYALLRVPASWHLPPVHVGPMDDCVRPVAATNKSKK
ncbi:hypothetical protein TIFTF001_012347 [Ficus carica]|uniref:Uncharacterized protein n=1 Tax=Ficus carica TaxID=3494 RepID=A0AA88AN67_FICCA|nr:hypothetical protein TIFTF001_012347 [Ficus carica]